MYAKFIKVASLTQKTDKVCSWAYSLKNNQVRQFVKFLAFSTPCTHVRDLSRPSQPFIKRPMIVERRPNFAIFVVWIASFVWAESLERKGSISSCSFYGQLSDYYHTFLVLSTQWMSPPSRKWGPGISPRIHLVVFVFGVN